MSYHLFRDPWLKAGALVLAVLLWMVVSGEPVVERGLDVPLEFENVPPGLAVLGNETDSVRVRVRGLASALARLSPGTVVARLDLSGEQPGSKLYDVFADGIAAPPGVEVTSVTPATVVLTLERTGIIRMMPIVPDIEGVPPKGLADGRITAVPLVVDVVGPQSGASGLREALTEPVSVAEATEHVVARVAVGVADPTLLLTEPLSADVTVEIVSAPVERTIQDIPVIARDIGGATGVRVVPDRIAITVRGSKDAIQSLSARSVAASVDVSFLAELPRRRYNLPVVVELSPDVRVVHIEPPSVQVALR